MSRALLANAAPVVRISALRTGDRLDHFLIGDLVARSGMASIFKATDLRDGKPVAIKIPHPEMEKDPLFLARFQREAEIGRDLDHPGVMKVFPGNQSAHVYTVMEWVEGCELRKFLRGAKKVPAARAVAITVRICTALDYIHSSGVVHRDLKPENIMVDEADRTKLIDFGIASRAGARQVTFGSLSQVMGTPDYISPEQISGQPGDSRSDVYALGVMLYEMLTGQTPFRGPNPFAVMNDRLVNNPIPPRELEPSITPELQEVIHRALRRDPETRYASAADFAYDLEHLDRVLPYDRAELSDWTWRRRPFVKTLGFYSGLALIPIVIFAALLQISRHSPENFPAPNHHIVK